MVGETSQPQKRYTVVIRFPGSLIRIPPGRGIRVAPVNTPHGVCDLSFSQRSEQADHIKEPIPRELWLEVNGRAPSLDAAVGLGLALANEFARLLAFGANAWQGLAGC